MFFSVLISIFFSIGFFFESIFGFGGGLIAYSFLGFFFEVKETAFRKSVICYRYLYNKTDFITLA
jgi:uncharacterized membrane protein YfcA